jgi:hypothetical protein
MSDVRVFVNGVGIEIARESTALDAVARVDRNEAEEVAAGRRMITDSRGLAVPARSEVFAGAIFRTVRARTPLSDTD